MWDIPRLHITAYSNSVSLVPLHPIFISILFHHYKQLKECTAHLLPTVIHDIQVSSNAFLLLLLELQQQSSYGKIALKLKIMKCMFERMREPLGQLETHV
jgi:hypothetical protein